ncbi:YokU family protein [Ectobacillus sp. JY-23]|uniref:YokU family protein n=1 Tax=Ectobacillus sp. JY-23 TaxID=2933872 RepID=UPI001FF6026F|nr:YokU family protein [Ectobacillus sp. JY-23]UOY93074.1 YokU family protein [Ectobacillus sp. JY-23]
MICEWCEVSHATHATNTVYWELPDGRKVICITETPCVRCTACGMEYQTEETTRAIEDQLFLIDTNELNKQLTYKELMYKERILKRNYFNFS